MTQFFLRGDFRFFWPESISNFATFPVSWDSSLNTGIGHSQLPALWIISYFNFTALFTKLGLDWNLIQIIFWIIPAILLSFFSAFFLFKHLFKEKKYSVLAGAIYSLNTYFLMILTGGQLGVSLAYSIVPLVLNLFIKLIDSTAPNVLNFKFQISNLKLPILTGFILSLQVLFDPRIVYITLVAVLVYLRFDLSKLRTIKNILSLSTPFVIAVLLNSFWIFPLILNKSQPLPTGFDSTEGFKFFSFADFSHSLSLLHPNWPENIFGKVYFLDPKFLILPIVAFSSLLFVRTMKQSSNKTIFFFSILSLLGIFLAKGSNPPFGEINQFLFEHFPGMSMFRDPTKWYILIALSYSILIPFSIASIYEWLMSRQKFQISNFKFQINTNKILNSPNLFLISAILYLIFLVSPILGQIKFRDVPKDYVQLKNLFSAQENFSRTLWIPKWQRFGYFSNLHPAIGREELFKGDYRKQIKQLRKSEGLLRDLSIKYIIVPYDSGGEIFLEDRRYSEKKRQEVEKELDKINFLKKVKRLNDLNHLSRITIYEIKNPKDHFWSPSTSLGISYQMVNPTEYKVKVQNVREDDLLVFSEAFDKNWSIKNSEFGARSLKYENLINSFVLPKNGNYEFEVKYEPQKYVEAGMIISLASLAVVLVAIKFGKSFKKW